MHYEGASTSRRLRHQPAAASAPSNPSPPGAEIRLALALLKRFGGRHSMTLSPTPPTTAILRTPTSELLAGTSTTQVILTNHDSTQNAVNPKTACGLREHKVDMSRQPG